MSCLTPYLIKITTIVKSRLFHVSFPPLSVQVAKLAALSSALPFAWITVYAATEKESRGQLVKPNQVGISLFVTL